MFDKHIAYIVSQYAVILAPALLQVLAKCGVILEICTGKDAGIITPAGKCGGIIKEFCSGLTDPGQVVDSVGDGLDFVGKLWKLFSGHVPVQTTDTVYRPVDPHGKGSKVVLAGRLLIACQQVQDLAAGILRNADV